MVYLIEVVTKIIKFCFGLGVRVKNKNENLMILTLWRPLLQTQTQQKCSQMLFW